MRIVHVTDCYLPRTGGIETQVRSLALAQRDRGHDVRVVTASPGHDGVRSGPDLVDGIPVERIAMSLPGELPIHPRTRSLVAQSLRGRGADVVHVHAGVISPFAWGAVRAAHGLGVPTVVTVHSVWGPLARPAFRGSDALVRWTGWGVVLTAVSEAAAQPIRSALPRATRVGVLPNGIEPGDWRDTRPRVARDAGMLRVVSVLRLAPRKRAGALLRAISRAAVLLQTDVSVTATIIGDGPERQRAQRLAERLGVATDFTGRLTREAIKDRFRESDIFVQASVRESFGVAALEARTFGLPVIARLQTGTGDFVDSGVNGILAADDRGIADAIVRLGRDPRVLADMWDYNLDHLPDQTWDHVCALAGDYYREAGVRNA